MAGQLHSEFRKIPYKWRLRYGYYQFFDHFLGRSFFSRLTKRGRRRFFRKLAAWLKSTGEGKIIPVERRENLSYQEFMRDYVNKGVPVILSGAAKEWGCATQWSLDYFSELHGDDEIVTSDYTKLDYKAYNKTTLREVIEKMKQGNGEYYRFYPLLKRHPEHINDFDYRWIRDRRKAGGVGESFQVFISGADAYTPLHNASAHNIFTQAYGEKKWHLYPKEYTCIVDPDPARNIYRNSPKRNDQVFNPYEEKVGEGFELYKYLDGYEVHLRAGDVFYNPPYMWHCVKNPTDSIGVGYRYYTPVSTWASTPLYMFLELFTFRPPVWKSWRSFSDLNAITLAENGELPDSKEGVEPVAG